MNSLPVPPHNAEYHDILEFKRSRIDQLNLLHHEIDLLSAKLAAAPLEEAARIGADEIRIALNELDRVFKEKWPHRTFKTLKAAIGDIAFGAVAGAIAAHAFSAPIALAAAAGGTVRPVFKALVTGVVAQRKIPERAAPYLYAYEAGQNLKA